VSSERKFAVKSFYDKINRRDAVEKIFSCAWKAKLPHQRILLAGSE
jgi:hypothetical protein